MASNGPQRARIQNFEKQKQKCPKEYCAKNDVPMSKTDTILSRSNVTWTVPFVDT